ncbi:PRD domain-containing protein [Enterococcus sp. LJL120]
MRYLKKINNNVALVEDDNHKEYIILGNGIGFNKKAGDAVDESLIEKKFIADQEPGASYTAIAQAVNEIDPKILAVTTKITGLADQEMGTTFPTTNFFALADHLQYAIVRGATVADAEDFTRIEIKKFYPKEYQLAKETIALVKTETGVQLPPAEEVYLTYHFLNASSNFSKADEAANMTAIIQRILDIISYHLHLELKEDSLSYSRFITHLRYFILRKINHEENDVLQASGILDVVKEKYKKSYQAALKVSQYLAAEKSWQLSEDEMLYLTLHIQRVIQEN